MTLPLTQDCPAVSAQEAEAGRGRGRGCSHRGRWRQRLGQRWMVRQRWMQRWGQEEDVSGGSIFMWGGRDGRGGDGGRGGGRDEVEAEVGGAQQLHLAVAHCFLPSKQLPLVPSGTMTRDKLHEMRASAVMSAPQSHREAATDLSDLEMTTWFYRWRANG
jgi:hypothetical protein